MLEFIMWVLCRAAIAVLVGIVGLYFIFCVVELFERGDE